MSGKAKGKNQKTPNETSHFRVENQHAYTLLLQAHAHECDVCVCVCEREPRSLKVDRGHT